MRLRRLWIWQLRISELWFALWFALRRMLRWRLWLRWNGYGCGGCGGGCGCCILTPICSLLHHIFCPSCWFGGCGCGPYGGGYCGGPCYGGCGYGGGCGFNGCCEPSMVFNDGGCGSCGGCGGCGYPAPCGSCCGGSPIMQGYPTGGCSSCGVQQGPTDSRRFLFRHHPDRPLLSQQPCTIRLRIARRCRLSREQADRSSIPVTRR